MRRVENSEGSRLGNKGAEGLKAGERNGRSGEAEGSEAACLLDRSFTAQLWLQHSCSNWLRR